VGFINPQIYTLTGGFHDVTAGDNQVSFGSHKNVGYKAGPGWDACSGLGSPDGASLAGLLTAHAPAAPSVAKKKAATKKKWTKSITALGRIEQLFDTWDNITATPIYGKTSGYSHE
jgi:hypothetical protein